MISNQESEANAGQSLDGVLTVGLEAYVATVQSRVIEKISIYLGAFIMSLTNE